MLVSKVKYRDDALPASAAGPSPAIPKQSTGIDVRVGMRVLSLMSLRLAVLLLLLLLFPLLQDLLDVD